MPAPARSRPSALGPTAADWIADRYATELAGEGLPAARLDDLLADARASAPLHRWDGRSEIRHAHFSNTPDELSAALRGDFQSVEGDVGLAGTVPVMRHNPRDRVEMTFRQWLTIVAAADFGFVKIDIKRDRVGPIIDEVRRAIADLGLAEERLVFAGDVFEGPGANFDQTWQERLYVRVALRLETEDLLEVARAFPRATISVGAVTGPDPGAPTAYDDDDLAAFGSVLGALREQGENPLRVSARWDLIDDALVGAVLSSGARLDVWSDSKLPPPDDADAEIVRLRARYGAALQVIDLGAATVSPQQPLAGPGTDAQ